MHTNGQGSDGTADDDAATESASTGPHIVGHVHLTVRDVEQSVEFYTAVLDLTLVERHEDYAFLSWGDRHHDVALQEAARATTDRESAVALAHAGFEVHDAAGLRAVYEALQARGVDARTADHGVSQAIYFEDPDGNQLQVYRDTRAERDQWQWAGTDQPFDPTSL